MRSVPRRAHPPHPAARAGGLAAVLLTCLALLLAVQREAQAHGVLRRSTPRSGAELSEAPRELRLTFSEPVELAVARLQLNGPDGAVQLAPLALHPDSSNLVIATIRGPLVAGAYTVLWQVVGADGHPVRGEFGFALLPGATGLAAEASDTAAIALPQPEQPSSASEAGHHPQSSFPGDAQSFHAGSPLFSAVRWLVFVGLLGVIGAVAFRALVLPLARRRDPTLGGALLELAASRAAALGLGMAALLAVAALLRLLAQSYALSGGMGAPDASLLGAVLTRTTWGQGWMLQVTGTALALAGFAVARRGSRGAWTVAGLGAATLAFSSGLMGHAAATSGRAPLAVFADGLHVLGAGGWLGSLLALVLVGVPVALRAGSVDGRRAVAALVHAFSPTALLFAAVVVATGVLAAWLHVGSWGALWDSDYGRTLLLKLAVLSVVFATGAYNWLRVRPALGREEAVGRLRRSAALELGAGVAVLAVTAVLVATATPAGEPEPSRTAASGETHAAH